MIVVEKIYNHFHPHLINNAVKQVFLNVENGRFYWEKP